MTAATDVPEGWTEELEAGWWALCDDVDTDCYVHYLRAGGQRSYHEWRTRPLTQQELACLSSRHDGTFAERTEQVPGVVDDWTAEEGVSL